jgi:hypothetical protein
MNKLKTILIVALALIIAGFAYNQHRLNNKLKEVAQAERKALIKADRLEKLADGLYTKLAADTLELAEMRRLNDSLGLELGKKPKVIIQTEFVPIPQEGEVDSVTQLNGEITIEDSYPKSEPVPFIKYKAIVSLKDTTAVGKFTFNPISINLGIEETEEGLFRVNTQVPDWIEITSIDVQALPMTQIKPDNFGILLGVGYGKDFKNDANFMYLSGGIRFKKIYLELQGGTNETISTGLKYEF